MNADKVYIVLRNGSVDEVFDNLISAQHHVKALTKLWSLTKIIEKEVKRI